MQKRGVFREKLSIQNAQVATRCAGCCDKNTMRLRYYRIVLLPLSLVYVLIGVRSLQGTIGEAELASREKVAISLFCISLIILSGCWVYMTFIYSGDPESEMWAPIAGFFMGLAYGGWFAIVPAVYSFLALKNENKKSSKLILIQNLSIVWFFSICLLYFI